MASITIGERDYDIPKLTFKRIKRIWPIVQNIDVAGLSETTDPSKMLDGMDEVFEIFSIALNDPKKTADWIEDNILGPELPGLQKSLMDLLVDSGLADRKDPDAGEVTAVPASLSTATGTA